MARTRQQVNMSLHYEVVEWLDKKANEDDRTRSTYTSLLLRRLMQEEKAIEEANQKKGEVK